MHEQFIERNFHRGSMAIIEQAEAICRDYSAQGYNLTLRQVYYQFVARGLLGNNDRNYKRLGSIINDARLAGLLDWSYIEDRTRNVLGGFGGFTSPGDFIDSMVPRYHEPIWRGQEFRPEVWVEKEALADVVQQAAAPLRVPTFSCRGYVSQSEMYGAAKRMQTRRRQGHTPVVIHLGDHAPSGIDMTRDIRERLELMSGQPIEVWRIALNMDQIEEYQPPPNPAKLTDSRGDAYVEKFGYESWELDALEPSVLTALIRDALDYYVDTDLMDERLQEEAASEERMRIIADRWDDLSDRWAEVEHLIDS